MIGQVSSAVKRCQSKGYKVPNSPTGRITPMTQNGTSIRNNIRKRHLGMPSVNHPWQAANYPGNLHLT